MKKKQNRCSIDGSKWSVCFTPKKSVIDPDWLIDVIPYQNVEDGDDKLFKKSSKKWMISKMLALESTKFVKSMMNWIIFFKKKLLGKGGSNSLVGLITSLKRPKSSYHMVHNCLVLVDISILELQKIYLV